MLRNYEINRFLLTFKKITAMNFLHFCLAATFKTFSLVKPNFGEF